MGLVVRATSGPVRFFLSFGTMVMGLSGLPPRDRRSYVTDVRRGVRVLGACLRRGLQRGRGSPRVPGANVTMLRRRVILTSTVRG